MRLQPGVKKRHPLAGAARAPAPPRYGGVLGQQVAGRAGPRGGGYRLINTAALRPGGKALLACGPNLRRVCSCNFDVPLGPDRVHASRSARLNAGPCTPGQTQGASAGKTLAELISGEQLHFGPALALKPERTTAPSNGVEKSHRSDKVGAIFSFFRCRLYL